MNPAIVIPARWASSRFPGKPLAPIAGKILIQHVWERCRRARLASAVLVATDDERIADAARGFGAEVVLTSPDHPTGTDRLAEVAAARPDITHIINVQGDEPLIPPALIDALIDALARRPGLRMATAAHRVHTHAEFTNPNIVKVVLDAAGDALYFSRAPIPHPRGAAPGHVPPGAWRHHGIYAYTSELLRQFVTWPPSPLETLEQLEQLRALENGVRIHVIPTEAGSIGVDVPSDVALVEAALDFNAKTERREESQKLIVDY